MPFHFASPDEPDDEAPRWRPSVPLTGRQVDSASAEAEPSTVPMDAAARAAWWAGLPAGLREEIDGYVLMGRSHQADRLIGQLGLVPDGIGPDTARLITADRVAHHGDRGARDPVSPLDLESLARKAAGTGGPVAAVAAVQGEHPVRGRVTELFVVTADAGERHTIARVDRPSAEHFLGAAAPDGGPLEVLAAERAGRALAEYLGVPFRFAARQDAGTAPAADGSSTG
ncbi:hypothetical protein ACIRBX_03210 [Kitasatospora sp. NPDC096147]|uniref:hypothetical protein n=1 Tax=Kitasatospora sp. NPDC096147 TaxID=3364093 RepID=UPI0037FAC2FA